LSASDETSKFIAFGHTKAVGCVRHMSSDSGSDTDDKDKAGAEGWLPNLRLPIY